MESAEARAALRGSKKEPPWGGRAGAAGLLLVDVLFGQLLGEGLAIRDLLLAHGAFDAEFRAHAVQRDFQMQFAHAAHDGLTRFAVGFPAQRGIAADNFAPRISASFPLRL